MKIALKTAMLVAFLTSGLPSAQAQGTLQFTVALNGANEVPPNNRPLYASGSFSLDGNSLSYEVGAAFTNINDIFYPTSGGIYGPAGPGQNGTLIFDLGNYHAVINPPLGTYGGYSYYGGFTLTPQQISDLEADLWYVNFASSTYPLGEIRGQIQPVPEPSAWALMVIGSCLIVYCKRKKPPG